jgi:hypothetical protein
MIPHVTINGVTVPRHVLLWRIDVITSSHHRAASEKVREAGPTFGCGLPVS